jgi:hypothetical protein
MRSRSARSRTLACLAVAALGAANPLSAGFLGFGAPKDADVNVVVDMTDAGRKVAPPTKEKPAFYFPVLAGYREAGSLVAGFYAGVALASLPHRDTPAGLATTWASAAATVGAVVLVVAALWLEYLCRLPLDDDRAFP